MKTQKITEKMLLDNYSHTLPSGYYYISNINGQEAYWNYRRYHDMGAAVCGPDAADVITLDYDRHGEIVLDSSHDTHPNIQQIKIDEAKAFGTLIETVEVVE